jgi:photosystem II stability/assembly factor-like uncharacterized protein
MEEDLMATKAKKRAPKSRQIQHAKPPPRAGRRRRLLLSVAGAVLVVVGVLALTMLRPSGSSSRSGLPNTPDYHSLLVDRADPQKLTLGTHDGLYVSTDGGAHWRPDALAGSDAMNLAQPNSATIWLAGHDVFKQSRDNGKTWSDVRPTGLPGLDIHGFAVDPRNPAILYAALAGQGLYRSVDGGRSFRVVSHVVGGSVMALAVLRDGRILAGDMTQGLLASGDGGSSWRKLLAAQLIGLAVNPQQPQRVLASGGGIALSTDGGRSWRSVIDLPRGAGPIAWSPSDSKLAYAVGLDRVLYRSTDAGGSWQPVKSG